MFNFRLKTFLALCETRSYTRAAQRLHITQPSVTQHIQYLENYYNCDLFYYKGRELSLTPQAIILKKHANSLRYQEKKLLESLKPSAGYSLKIGATKTIGEYVIPGQLSRFLASPQNKLSVEIDNTRRILTLLDKGQIDFGIIEGFFDKLTYESKLYGREAFVGFCSKNHPFAGRKISIEDLLQEDLIVREKGSGTRKILEQLLLNHNYSFESFSRTICINNFGLLESLVANDCGVTFAYLAAGINNSALDSFAVKGWSLSRDFNYVYLKDTQAKKLVEVFNQYK
ncbi:MAG TPA: LysR family transcriptional regulator [Clostridia bacterium]|nr:LysR family transcriptional regulator [Clostridia bacterium]